MKSKQCFKGHYPDWTSSRIKCLEKYIGKEFFKDKTVLEVGCGHGHNGNILTNLGSLVTSVDARETHLTHAKKLYPHMNFEIFDADKDKISLNYDIILHWGLLYHLKQIETHIANVCSRCKCLLLESIVSDSEDDTYYVNINESTKHHEFSDQAFNSIGIRPSPFYVEKLLKKNGFNFKIIKDSLLNTDCHVYDWDHSDKSTHTKNCALRRFWICWKDEYLSLD